MTPLRPAAPTEIVDPSEILSSEQIITEKINYLSLAFHTPLECLEWMAKRRLLSNTRKCDECQLDMTLTKRAELSDGYRWKCRKCRGAASIRKNSFFFTSRLSLIQLTSIVYGWSRNYHLKDIAHEAEVSFIAQHSLIEWCSFCRAVCEQYLIDNPTVVGGLCDDLISKVVEIDEADFFHEEYRRNQRRKGHWVFGGIERGTGECFMVEVPDRCEHTLSSIIEKHILPGTIIVSDNRRMYENISRIKGGIYEHFVDYTDRSVHIQRVKKMWLRAEKKLQRQYRCSKTLFPSHLHEFLWRNRFRNQNLFGHFITCIAQQYVV